MLQIKKIGRPIVVSDNLRDMYTALADDSSAAEKRREAAVYFSMAETQLDEEEDPEVARTTANQALGLFREIGDTRGVADTLRLILHAQRTKAEIARYSGSGWDVEELLSG